MTARVFAALAALMALGCGAHAQSLEQFYRGRTLNLVIPNAPGGSFDLYGRLVARHIGRFLPGQPGVVAQNMPGAGGMIASNWLYGIAPRDGTAIGVLVPNVALAQVIGVSAITYDVRKFNWIGRIVSPTATLFTWHTAATKKIADLKLRETIVASTGQLSQVEITSRMMTGIADTKFKIIEGYKGTTDATLAMEQGEVEAVVMPWTLMKLAHPDWIRDKKISVIAQYTRKPVGDLADTPSVFVLAQTADQRGVFALFFGPDEIGQPLVAPPGAPAERVEALRTAFEAMNRDAEYLADAARQKLDLTPATWRELANTVAEAFQATPAQVEIARKYYR